MTDPGSDKNGAILAALVDRARREPAFLAEFKGAPAKVFLGAGGKLPAGKKLVLLENTPTLYHFILPPVTGRDKYRDEIQKAARSLPDLAEGIQLRVVRDMEALSHVVIPACPGEIASGGRGDAVLA